MSIKEHFVVAKEIISSNGIKGLYAGFAFKAIHLGGSGACMACLIPIFSEMMNISYGGI